MGRVGHLATPMLIRCVGAGYEEGRLGGGGGQGENGGVGLGGGRGDNGEA